MKRFKPSTQISKTESRFMPTIWLNKMIAEKIKYGLKQKEWNVVRFALEMKRSSSEISKWLRGDHNFTTSTLAEIGAKLEIEFFNANIYNNNISVGVKTNSVQLQPGTIHKKPASFSTHPIKATRRVTAIQV